MNHITLIGRLTADPELRQSPSGVSSVRFTVAIDRQYKDKQTGERQSDFISCVAFRQTAEFISRYFGKGKMIALEGSLRNNNYQDKKYQDVMHYSYDVFVEQAEFCGDKSGNGQQNQSGNQQNYNNQYNAPPQQQYNVPPQNQQYQQGYNSPPQNGYNQPPQGYQGGNGYY